MQHIRLLIVDDSAFMRKVLSDMLVDQPNIEVVGKARNGKVAIDLIQSLKPDVVTLDIEMPVMDGLTALDLIMKQCPVSVIMLSSLTETGADATLQALDRGAVDFIAKPSSVFKVKTEDLRRELIAKITAASRVSALHSSSRPSTRRPVSPSVRRRQTGKLRIVAIGTSTGGPKALQQVIPELHATINAAIIVVQHMPVGFTKSLADRLNQLSHVTVKEAEQGDVLRAGHCYIAPGGQHVRIMRRADSYYIQLEDGPTVSGHKPSVDAMFYSLVDLGLSDVVAVIMTGMGSDGAQGLGALKKLNNKTLAQDETSCVVYGMPGSAVRLGAVDNIVPLGRISAHIERSLED